MYVVVKVRGQHVYNNVLYPAGYEHQGTVYAITPKHITLNIGQGRHIVFSHGDVSVWRSAPGEYVGQYRWENLDSAIAAYIAANQ